jgi:starch synthase
VRVLFVSSEAYPLIKTGGLADVSGALPKALRAQASDASPESCDIKILIPGYRDVLSKLKATKTIASVTVLNQLCTIVQGTMPDSQIEVLAIQNASLYERDGGPYNQQNGEDWPDNALRFGVLSRLASLLASPQSPIKHWQPELVHCNDWQTGLTPAYMKLVDKVSAKSIFSIHNIAFQGCFHEGWRHELMLPAEGFSLFGYEYYGQLSFLKAGVFYADQISTVSPTYAREIQTPAFGFGMQGLLQERQLDLTGILNGIDTTEWNPKTDVHLPAHFSAKQLAGKQVVKRSLQNALGLIADESAPLLGVVSRLTYQKGLDLLPAIMPLLLEQGCQFAILGSGEPALEAAFQSLASAYPTQVSFYNGYNEPHSHLIMAGSDLFIMPSRFEPCGLNQLYGLSYGTPPLVTQTGGLADSVTNTTEATLKNKTATGFVMPEVNNAALLSTIQRALALLQDKARWQQVQRNGMRQDVSWDSSAKAYLALYKKTLQLS